MRGVFLKPITARWVSKVAGRYLDSRFSRHKIKGYVKKHRIDMSQYETENYPSFNAFFTRRIRKELRPFDTAPEAFVAPCDGKLSLYPIADGARFNVKGFDYTAAELLKNAELAKKIRRRLLFRFPPVRRRLSPLFLL